MDFKSLGENSQIYIIRKKPFMYLTGTLKSKTAKNQNIAPYMLQAQPQTYDIVINVNGNDEILSGVSDNMEVVEYKGSFYSASVNGILQAASSMVQMAKNGKEEQPYYDDVIAKGEKVIETLNPEYAESKKQARLVKDLQARQDEQGKKLDDIYNLLQKIAPKG
jgi:hypothetical protein